MRRAFVWFISVMVLGLTANAGFGQYPYPYAPMPVPYGYPGPMPAYMPNPMMARPMPMPIPYPPMPMPMYPNAAPPKVMVFGPLDQRMEPMTLPVPSKRDLAPAASPGGLRQAQAEVSGPPTVSKQEIYPDSCGSDDCVGALHDPRCWQKPTRGKGHFIGEVGAYFLSPFSSTRFAYNLTTAGQTEAVDFPHYLDVGPRVSLGYIAHTGWGVRANYGYLTGVATQSAVVTPTNGLGVSSAYATINAPTPTVTSGIGADNFDFKQRLQVHMADLAVVKEACFLDTTFLFNCGARYARINQSYSAIRTNVGGIGNPPVTVAFDREDQDSSSYFSGWGPTMGFEIVHPFGCGFSGYTTVQGAFLFGNDRFSQNYRNQRRSTDFTGAANFVDTSATSTLFDNRYVSFVEPEVGIQFGCRFHGCYLFARTGAVYQRWWDVGTATTFSGSLNMVGGTMRVGIVY